MATWAEISGLEVGEFLVTGNWGRVSGLTVGQPPPPAASMVKPPPPLFVVPGSTITLEASISDPDTDPSLISIRFEKATDSAGPWTEIATTAAGTFTHNWDTTGEALGFRFIRAIAIDEVSEGPPSSANKIRFVDKLPAGGSIRSAGKIRTSLSGMVRGRLT